MSQTFTCTPCVRSGLCCKKGPCAFGEWDSSISQCKFLEEETRTDEYTTYRCGKYEEIQALPKEQTWANPAFGAGCCMPLGNTNRNNILSR